MVDGYSELRFDRRCSMNVKSKIVLPETLLQCEICLKEVPASEMENAETAEYVAYFCGLECYDIWHKKEKHSEKDD